MVFFLITSCGMKPQTCNEAKKVFSNLEFQMTLKRWKLEGNHIYLYGFDINNSSKEVNYHNDETRDFQFIKDYFHKDDIIIKKKNDDFIKIYHGKDRFKFTYQCVEEYGDTITKFKQDRF